MSTCVIYIDEAGSNHKHHIPLRIGETPLFTLGAVAFPLSEWRIRDRELLEMKRHYFPDRMNRPGRRDEHVEIKGNELAAPRNASNTRYHAFLKAVLSFIPRHSGVCFAVSFLKNPADPTAPTSLYTHALQILVERLSAFISEHLQYENATLICDSRARGLSGEQNLEVIKSHMSYIFGHCTGRTCTNILEAPLFADSRFCAGVQLADIVASVCFANHYQYYLTSRDRSGVAGYFDYSHMPKYWPVAKSLIWRGQTRVRGFPRYGMRVVDYRRVPQSSKARTGP